ncbi:hypothetical protein GDO81_018460 [Engystomops pustulosus]|uniref:Transposase element L1Md-A101/L1Md-A102/L1Md-A2 n=1 Tax=Engystomops pustulosus TaxID=76066 RepID=A0AAV6ZP00_ENGPU|nr:hypothetical protein GDO81_018460 [Engystomops pustulosus]
MERYLLRSGQKSCPSPRLKTGGACSPCPRMPSLESHKTSAAEETQMTRPAVHLSEPAPSKVGDVDYQLLAREVAKCLAPDLVSTLTAAIQATLTEVKGKVQDHEERISTLEECTEAGKESIATMTTTQQQIEQLTATLADRIEDLENRSRRSNLRLVGLPENVQGGSLRKIFEEDLPRALGVGPRKLVERAHRIGPPGVNGGEGTTTEAAQRPRQVIAKYLNYADKEEILRAYRNLRAPLFIRGQKVLLFADFSVAVMRKRKLFSPLCSSLAAKNARFQLAYPALLRIKTQDGVQHEFNDPSEAESFVAQLPAENLQLHERRPRRTAMEERRSSQQRVFRGHQTTGDQDTRVRSGESSGGYRNSRDRSDF